MEYRGAASGETMDAVPSRSREAIMAEQSGSRTKQTTPTRPTFGILFSRATVALSFCLLMIEGLKLIP